MKNKKFIATTAIVAGALSLASTQVLAGAPSAAEKERERAATYLAATQAELGGGQFQLDSARLDLKIPGYEIFSLQGPREVCLLTVRPGQDAGRSTGLACAERKGASTPNKPMTFQVSVPEYPGIIDVSWKPDGASKVTAADADGSLEVIEGQNATAVLRPSGKSGSLRWVASNGESSSIALPSERERAEQVASPASPAN